MSSLELQESYDFADESGSAPLLRSSQRQRRSRTNKSGRSGARCEWARRHRTCCRVLCCCCILLLGLLIGLGVFGFLLYSITGARLTEETIVDVFDLCSFNGTTLIVNGDVHNPSVIPVTMLSTSYQVYDKADDQLLAHGDLSLLDLKYGLVKLENYTTTVKHGDNKKIAAVASSYFANNPLDIYVTALINAKLFGVALSTTAHLDFHFGKHTNATNSPMTVRTVNIAENSANRATIEAEIGLSLSIPWMHIHVPKTIELEIFNHDKSIATLGPQKNTALGNWILRQGVNDLALNTTISKDQAANCGASINEYTNGQGLALEARGTAQQADQCWAQKVLSLAKLVPDLDTKQQDNDASLMFARLVSSNTTSLGIDAGASLGKRFYGGKGAPDDKNSTIVLTGEIPSFSFKLSSCVNDADTNAAMPQPNGVFDNFAVVHMENWTFCGSPTGHIDVFISDAQQTATLVDSASLHARNSWIEVSGQAAGVDVLSHIIAHVSQRFQVGSETSNSHLVQYMIDHLAVNVSKIADTSINAVVTTSIDVASFARNAALGAHLNNIELDVFRLEGATANKKLASVRVDLDFVGTQIRALVSSTSLEYSTLAAALSDVLSEQVAFSIYAEGAKQTTAHNATVVTRILEHLRYDRTFIDPKAPSPADERFQIRRVATEGGRGGAAHLSAAFVMPANKFLTVQVPSVAFSIGSKSLGKTLALARTLPLHLVPGSVQQVAKLLLDVPDVELISKQTDSVFAGTPDVFTITGISKTLLNSKLLSFGAMEDSCVTRILQQWTYAAKWGGPQAAPVAKGGVLPVIDMKTVRSTAETLTLSASLPLNLPAGTLPCDVVVGDFSLEVQARRVTAAQVRAATALTAQVPRVTVLKVALNELVVRNGNNTLQFEIEVNARAADQSKYALQHAIYSLVSTPQPLRVWLKGAVKPSGSAEPPFAVEYQFTVPKGGAGTDNEVLACMDKPIKDIHPGGLTGSCWVDISITAWIVNPTSLPLHVNKVDFRVEFDDKYGIPGIYKKRDNVVLGRTHLMTPDYSLPPFGVAPLAVTIVDGKTANKEAGWKELCARLANVYFIRNKLVVSLEDGAAELQIENFKLQVPFSNISMALDKNQEYPVRCEDIMRKKGFHV